jgi:hypothetical protein
MIPPWCSSKEDGTCHNEVSVVAASYTTKYMNGYLLPLDDGHQRGRDGVYRNDDHAS